MGHLGEVGGLGDVSGRDLLMAALMGVFSGGAVWLVLRQMDATVKQAVVAALISAGVVTGGSLVLRLAKVGQP